jgi:ribose/xylose/arabinose/galactoside ABC-type transport system permease subunit
MKSVFNRETFFARTNGVLLASIIIVIVFSILNSYFFTVQNFFGLLRLMSTLAIVALGQLLVIVSGELDLSVGSIYGLVAMSMGILWINGVPLYLSLPIALLIGVISGAFTAWLVTSIRIPSFVVTLGMYNILRGITLLISNSKTISPAYVLGEKATEMELKLFNNLGGMELPFHIPMQLIWMIIIAILVWFLYNKFIFGFRLRAIGGNLEAAKLMHLPVTRYKYFAFMICGLFAGLAGILDFSFIGTADPGGGTSITFAQFAVVIIGGAKLSGGRGNVRGTLIAAFLMTVLSNGLSLLGVGSFAQLIFLGVVTIGAVVLDTIATIKGGGLNYAK